MSDSSHKQYTAEDFSRYHSGAMSEREMYDLERAALQDPFLADALEGYAFTQTPKEDIEEINERLNKKDKRKGFVVSLPFLRVAAMIVIIAGAATLFYVLNRKNEGMQPTAGTISKQAPTATVAKDSSTVDYSIKELSTDSTMKGATALSETHIVANKRNSANEVVSSKQSNKEQLHGLSYDNNSNVVGAIPDVTSKKDTTTLNAEEAKQDIAFSRVMIGKDKAAPRSADSSIALKEVSKQESVNLASTRSISKVTGKKSSENEATVSSAIQGRVAGILITQAPDTLAAPVGGWQEFNTYVQQQVQSSLTTKAYHGTVVLSFLLSDSGKPRRIRVEQSSCDACEKEAKRILKDGPPWKYIQEDQKRVRVTLHF